MRPVRALVAGDQKVVRDGLCLMLGLLAIEVTGAAGGTDAVRQAAAVPDVGLMDLHMPDGDGVEATRLILRQQPSIRVVVLTAFSDDDPASGAPGGCARLPHQERQRRRDPPGDAGGPRGTGPAGSTGTARAGRGLCQG